MALDIEVVGAVAPGARIAVYFAPNTFQGFIDCLSAAVHDSTNNPSVISISWGAPEVTWGGSAIQAFDQVCQDAALMGVTVCAASGDNGSSDGSPGDNVDYPASDPFVLGCGGTTLSETGGTITNEVCWSGSGGGVSVVFGLPTYQNGAGVPQPGGQARRGAGYQIVVGGQTITVGGTSAVAPLWSGLIALTNDGRGASVGFVHPALYANPTAMHDITSGSNGDFSAGPGWDACTGLGSPDGNLIRQVLSPTPLTWKFVSEPSGATAASFLNTSPPQRAGQAFAIEMASAQVGVFYLD